MIYTWFEICWLLGMLVSKICYLDNKIIQNTQKWNGGQEDSPGVHWGLLSLSSTPSVNTKAVMTTWRPFHLVLGGFII